MAIIYSYPIETNIQSTDLLIGTSTIVESGVQRNVTRSFSVGGLAAFINTDLLEAVTSITFTAPLTGGTITKTGNVGITQSGLTTNGYLSSVDWNTFNNKFNPPTGVVNTIPLFTTQTTLGSSALTQPAGNYIYSNKHFSPLTDNTWDLGTSTVSSRWKNIYSSATVYSANLSISGYLNTSNGNGSPGQVLESQGAGQPVRWVDKTGGDVTAVTSSTLPQLTVANSTGPIPSLSIVTAPVITGGTALATGNQIYNFVDSNYGNGTVTSIGMTVPTAFVVTPATITTNGTFAISASGNNNQVILGDGTLGTLTSGTVTSVGFTSDIAAFAVGGQPIVAGGTLTLNLTGGTTGQFLRQDGTWATVGGGSGTVTGTGVANNIALWTGTSVVGQSMLTQDAGATLVTNSGSFKTTSITDSAGLTGTSGQVLTAGAGGAVTWGTGASSYTKWVLTGQLGSQDVTDGNTVLFTSGNAAITTAATSPDTLTITSTAYTGGTNIGHVPGTSGGDATKHLDGSGNWQTTPTGTGTVTEVTSATPNLLTIADETTTPAITAVTSGGVSSVSTSLATGSQIQTAIDAALVGFLEFKGGFNATTGAIVGGGNLTTGATRVAIAVGDFYVVTVAGDFYGDVTEPLDIGDQVICQTVAVAGASVIGDWVKVQENIGVATATTLGVASYPVAGGLAVNAAGEVSVGSSTGSTLAFVTDVNNVDMTSTSLGVVNSTVQFTRGSAMELTQASGNNMTIDLNDSGVTQGQYYYPIAITVDTKGRITNVVGGGSGLSGTGTAGKIAKWGSPNAITNSIMTETTGLITTAGSIKPTSITDASNITGTANQVLTSGAAGGTLTWASAVGEIYTLLSQTDGSNVDLKLDATSAGGADSTVQFTAGSNMTITSNIAGTDVTFASEEINEIIVTVAQPGGNYKYYIDGALQQSLELVAGFTYRLDQSDSSNSGHQLLFSTNASGTPNYTTGVTTSTPSPGSAGAYTQIILEQDTPKLYYYCTNHANMGGEVIDPRAADTFTSFTATDGQFIDLTPNTAQTGVVTLTADLSANGAASITTFLSGNNSWETVVTSLTTTNSNYIDLADSGTAGVPVLTASLSAGVPSSPATKFLRGDNTWQTVAGTTYDYTSTTSGDDVNLNLVGSGAAGTDSVKLVAGSNISLTDDGSNNVTVASTAGSGGGVITKDDFTSSGIAGPYPLSGSPLSKLYTDVFISGVYQEKETYDVANGVLTFVDVVISGLSIEVMSIIVSNLLPGTNTLSTETFTANGSATITLSTTPTNIDFTSVYVNGVYQEKTNAYTVSGAVITWVGSPPATGDIIQVEIVSSVSLVTLQPQNYAVSTISASTTAVKNTLYVFTANLTLTLPATPFDGDSIKISNLSAVATCVLARNGSLIMGSATDLILNNAVASFELIYSGATKGWVIIGPQ